MKYISPTELKKWKDVEEVQLLDVREPYEFNHGNIGGWNCPMAELVNHTDRLNRNAPLVIICRSGKRAEAVANFLEKEANFSDLSILDGGLMAWKECINPNLDLD
jgi:rhodanese-related sulfurtransferase